MKPLPTYGTRHAVPGAAIFLALVLTISSCSTQKVSFATSTVVPTAEGTVKVKRDGNNNYSININIKHLAQPNRLVPAKTVYVVWAETKENGTKNLGRLNTSSGLFSSTLKSSLTTVSPVRPTMIFITAENDAAIEYPGSQVVLTTSSF